MDIINSFTDTIKERTKNPFFGTLILVWLFRNWEVVFAIFNFEKDFGLEEKLNFIKNFYKDKSLFGLFFANIGIALVLMILGYLLVILTRVMVSIVERKWMPYLDEKTDNKSVVNKERFNDVKKTRDEYAQANEDLQELLIQSQQKLGQQKLESERLLKDIEILSSDNSKLHDEGARNAIKIMEGEKVEENLFIQINGLKNDLNALRESNISYLEDKYVFSNLVAEYLKGLNINELPNSLGIIENIVFQSYLKLLENKLLERFIDFYDKIFEMPSSIKKSDTDLDSYKLYKEQDLIRIDGENKIVTTPFGDFVYLLGKSGIARKRGMGL